MFKSIFAKYITAVTAIVLASFFILASVVSSIISNGNIDKKMADVEHAARLGADISVHGYDGGEYSGLHEYFVANPDVGYAVDRLLHDEFDVCLMIMSMEGELIFAGETFLPTAETIASDEQLWQDILATLAEKDFYKENRALTCFDGAKYSVCAQQIKHDGMSVGVVIASSAHANSTRFAGTTLQAVILSCLWIMLAMLIAMYILTERIVDPIKRMSVASRNYAKGVFDTRIDVVGNDEVAELADAFNHMAGELDLLEKKRNQFISDVSHELRSPMMAILGFVDGLRSGAIPEEKKQYYMDITVDEIKRLSRLVADLLDVSRLEMGEKKLNFAKCDICDKTFFVMVSLEKRMEEKHLDVAYEAEADRLYVNADGDALHRVLYNLCENAIKFSTDGAKLRISIRETKAHEIVLEVFNEGIGIPAEDLPHVFDRFYKSDKSRGQDKKGVGLGLYFVKTILTAHKGNIEVDSEEGKYCRFTVTLPAYSEK